MTTPEQEKLIGQFDGNYLLAKMYLLSMQGAIGRLAVDYPGLEKHIPELRKLTEGLNKTWQKIHKELGE